MINGMPESSLIGLCSYKTPHLIHLGFFNLLNSYFYAVYVKGRK